MSRRKVAYPHLHFKENYPDIRNSRVIDVINELKEFGTDVNVYDPWVDLEEVKRKYGLSLLNDKDLNTTCYDAIVLVVAHNKFESLDIEKIRNGVDAVVYDIKSKLEESDGKL